jgi:hypothetical protein
MESTLIGLAVLAALAFSANMLTRARRVHTIAPVAVAIVCAGLLPSAAVARPHPDASPQVLPHYVMPYPPAGAGGPLAVACAGPYVPVGPATAPLPSVVGVIRHPPAQIDGPPGAPASVVLSSRFADAVPTAAATVGSALSSLDLFHYVLATGRCSPSTEFRLGLFGPVTCGYRRWSWVSGDLHTRRHEAERAERGLPPVG